MPRDSRAYCDILARACAAVNSCPQEPPQSSFSICFLRPSPTPRPDVASHAENRPELNPEPLASIQTELSKRLDSDRIGANQREDI